MSGLKKSVTEIYLLFKDEIIELLQKNQPLNKIAEKFNLNRNTLRRRLKADGLCTSHYYDHYDKTKQICPRCKTEKDISEFHKNQTYCILCQKEQTKNVIVSEENKLKYKETANIKIAQNREYHLIRISKYRAKKKGLEFNITVEDIIIPEFCPVLGVKINMETGILYDSFGPSIDRIDNSKGYIKENIMIMSRKANTMKSNATPEELLAFSKYFINKYSNNASTKNRE